jgi:predicted DNA-binding transcriptional regulator AlpA
MRAPLTLPQTLPLFLTSSQVAQLLDYPSAGAFLAHRARLEADHLFPLPSPTRALRNLRWGRDEVLAWITRTNAPRPSLGGNLVLLNIARTA